MEYPCSKKLGEKMAKKVVEIFQNKKNIITLSIRVHNHINNSAAKFNKVSKLCFISEFDEIGQKY